MKRIALAIISILTFVAIAVEVRLAWEPSPNDNQDTEVKYKVYYGTNTRTYTEWIDAGTNLTATVTGLASGKTWFFAATAYIEETGVESDFSNEVTYTPILNPPSGLRVDVVVTVTVTTP